jgi:hypothetical protein
MGVVLISQTYLRLNQMGILARIVLLIGRLLTSKRSKQRILKRGKSKFNWNSIIRL